MEFSNEFQISFGSVQIIFTDNLGKRRVANKIAFKLLSEDQKENWKEIATHLLEYSGSGKFFFKINYRGDETWEYGYDPQTNI